MPPKVQKSKKAKLLAAQSASKSKGKKKKWAKGKLREKKNHHVCFTQSLLDKILKDVPVKSKVSTTIISCIVFFRLRHSLYISLSNAN